MVLAEATCSVSTISRVATGPVQPSGPGPASTALASASGSTFGPSSERATLPCSRATPTITARAGGRLDPAAGAAAARDVTTRMRALPAVAGVGTPIDSADGTAVLVPVTMRGEQVAAKAELPRLLAVTDAVGAAHSDLTVAETGGASIGAGTDRQRGSDLALSEEITLPLTPAQPVHRGPEWTINSPVSSAEGEGAWSRPGPDADAASVQSAGDGRRAEPHPDHVVRLPGVGARGAGRLRLLVRCRGGFGCRVGSGGR
jgi:hypothetical protein